MIRRYPFRHRFYLLMFSVVTLWGQPDFRWPVDMAMGSDNLSWKPR